MEKFEMDVRKAISFFVYVFDNTKRKDFDTINCGVSFKGYYDRMGGRTTSACTKASCVKWIVDSLLESAQLSHREGAVYFMDQKLPGWREKFGFKEETRIP